MNKVSFYNMMLYSFFTEDLTRRGIKWKCNHKFSWLKLKSYLEVEICKDQEGVNKYLV